MATTAYADPAAFLGTSVPASWTPSVSRSIRRSLFGDLVLIAFLLAQCFDGVFTYIGVVTYGVGIEANPLLAMLMGMFGHGATLTGAKLLAASLGIALHMQRVHGAVAILAVFYFFVAIFPWMTILF